jgi:hypothetical protein
LGLSNEPWVSVDQILGILGFDGGRGRYWGSIGVIDLAFSFGFYLVETIPVCITEIIAGAQFPTLNLILTAHRLDPPILKNLVNSDSISGVPLQHFPDQNFDIPWQVRPPFHRKFLAVQNIIHCSPLILELKGGCPVQHFI